MDVKIEDSWKEILKQEFDKPYFQQIPLHLKTEKSQGKIIYPPGSLIFNAFNTTPLRQCKSRDHRPGSLSWARAGARALFFRAKWCPPPPSLINIFKELHDDIGMAIPNHGNLTKWAEQGVFLLNASLTVRAGEPMSHSKIGWAAFTDTVIKKISDTREHVVFLLWGKFALDKKILIDETKHLVLRSAHPSPLSAFAGFFGCKHFSKANAYLMSKGIDPVDWSL